MTTLTTGLVSALCDAVDPDFTTIEALKSQLAVHRTAEDSSVNLPPCHRPGNIALCITREITLA